MAFIFNKCVLTLSTIHVCTCIATECTAWCTTVFCCLQHDLVVGKKMGTGGFGAVYRGDLTTTAGNKVPVVIKKVWARCLFFHCAARQGPAGHARLE